MATTAAAAAAAAFAGGAKPRRRPVLHSRIAAGGRRRSVVVRCDAGVEAESQARAAVDAASRAALEQLENSGNRYMRARSSVGVIGLSVHTAPVEMREKLAVAEELWPRTILELTDLDHIHEAAVLSTCNRMEIYVVALSWNVGIREVVGWMSEKSGIPASELRKHIFMLRDGDAKCHLFEVAAGLDSLVLGEGQILAQVRQVVTSGENSGALGKYFNRMFKAAITAGKRVRSETNISSGAVSVSSAAVELALKKLPKSQCHSARMLLIGAGKMGKLVIKHLMAKGCKQVVVVNRSVDSVDAIREEMKEIEIVYRPLTEMYEAAADADVVFTSTASETPLFMKEHVEALPPVSEAIGGARLFIDISVPRNVGSCVSDLGYARVYNVDDLKEVVEANKEDRLRKATEARTVISQELKKFEAWSDSRQAFPTIKKLRSYADRIRVSEFEKCLQKIGGDALTKKERKSIEALSTGIVNKLLHGPMQHLRCDGSDSCTPDEISENVHALHRMFDLDTEEDDIEQIIKAKVKKAQS